MDLVVNIYNEYSSHLNLYGRGICMGMSLRWVTSSLDEMVNSDDACSGFTFKDSKKCFEYAMATQRAYNSLRTHKLALSILDTNQNLYKKTKKFKKPKISYFPIDGFDIRPKIAAMIADPYKYRGEALIFYILPKNELNNKKAVLHAIALITDGSKAYYLDPNLGIYIMEKSDNLETILEEATRIYHTPMTTHTYSRVTTYTAEHIHMKLASKSGIHPLNLLAALPIY